MDRPSQYLRRKQRLIGRSAIVSLAAFLAGCSSGSSPPTPKPEFSDQRISDADAARIKYSKQQFAYLDIGETAAFRLNDGRLKWIRLVSVAEEKDSVIHLLRKADVHLEIDGRPLDLTCSPYALPREEDGLRVQVDTTSGWLPMGKRVQLSLWDAGDPIVDTSLFHFPLAEYRLFSQGTQSYNEPVHLGHRDGDPGGQRFYHNYGFDMAGFEGRDRVVCPIEGKVIAVRPETGWVAIEDDRGIVIDCGHLDSIHLEIQDGHLVKRGEDLGTIGRKGPSGNYSHLHLGLYLSRKDFDADRSCRNLNLYPWILTAYQTATGSRLIAVARPHHTAITGEKVVFDGRNSVAFGGKIVSYRWEFPDGTSEDGPVAARTFDRPGSYTAVLHVEDDRGGHDFDVCRVRIYTAAQPEEVLTTLFFSVSPSLGLTAGGNVHFRGWPQGGETGPISLDFGDGTVLDGYLPFSDIEHRYKAVGTYIVTAAAEKAGRPAIAKLKVVIE
jgi:murein DD-endopeptidase MepM/ murein hydrolase activator NlpD